mmetsp:Transcript_35023/g.107531  ORF Transcript_35023/g.107531 Transcript_35023/m.107531 type:complete len:107 (-) Transcript_35023:141-461(-)
MPRRAAAAGAAARAALIKCLADDVAMVPARDSVGYKTRSAPLRRSPLLFATPRNARRCSLGARARAGEAVLAMCEFRCGAPRKGAATESEQLRTVRKAPVKATLGL